MGLSWPWRVLGSRVFVYGVMVREGDDIVKVARAVDSAAIMEYSGVSVPFNSILKYVSTLCVPFVM